jgi:hypothetical protein
VAVLEALAVATHSPVIAATTAALAACTYANGTAGVGATLTGNANGALAAQDGVTLTAGQRLLVKDQAAGAQNGVYTVTVVGAGAAPFILTRATDFDTAAEIVDGATFFVGQGTTLANSAFALTVNGAVTVGTTALVFGQTGGVSFPATQVVLADAGTFFTTDNAEAALQQIAESTQGVTGGSGLVGATHNARYLKGTYSFVAQGGVQGDIVIATTQIPAGALVTRLIYFVSTAFTSGGAATIGFKIQTANDLFASAILATNGGVGPHGAASLTTPILLTAARQLTMTVAVADLTAGVGVFFVEYVN